VTYNDITPLIAQDKTFTVELGPIPNGDADTLQQEHERVCKNQGDISKDDADRMFRECEAYREKISLTMAMLNKGFRLTCLTN
jgi:hypothetical protein